MRSSGGAAGWIGCWLLSFLLVGRGREVGVYAGETQGLEDGGSQNAIEELVQAPEWAQLLL